MSDPTSPVHLADSYSIGSPGPTPGPLAFGCPGGQPYGESVAGKIALIERCFRAFSDKINRAECEGAVGVIVFNNADEGLVLMGGDDVSIPSVFVAQSRGEHLADDREANETVKVTMGEGEFDGFGFARVFDISNPSNIRLLSNITLPSTFEPAAPNPFGVHNVFVRGNTAYFSWYQDGFVAVDISQPARPRAPRGPGKGARETSPWPLWPKPGGHRRLFGSARVDCDLVLAGPERGHVVGAFGRFIRPERRGQASASLLRFLNEVSLSSVGHTAPTHGIAAGLAQRIR